MTARITLRAATGEDLASIGEWYAEASRLAGLPDASGLESRRQEARAAGGDLLAIARPDDSPIGLIDYRLGEPGLTVAFIALGPGQRGWGYGSEAVRLLEESVDATLCQATVAQSNGLGLYFWLRLGYRPARPDEWRTPGDGVTIAMIRHVPRQKEPRNG